MDTLFITIVICFSYLIESIFGLGGAIIALSILGLFFDIKEIIPIVIYASIMSSTIILLSDPKSANFALLKRIFPDVALGTILGVFLFYFISGEILLQFFAIFIFYHAVKSLFFEPKAVNYFIKRLVLFISGVIHGIFGTGGPVALTVIKNDFIDKSQLRVTMAVFFICFNLIRVLQLYFFTDFEVIKIFQIWWLIVPLSIFILVGYRLHLAVNNKIFNKAVSILLLLTSIIFFIK